MMDKTERHKLTLQGFDILRPQHDERKSCWKISKHSRNGSWKRFGAAWYLSHDDAMKKIDQLIEMFPNLYVKE